MNRRRGHVFPRHMGFYDTVFSQPVFWALVVVVSGLLWAGRAWGLI